MTMFRFLFFAVFTGILFSCTTKAPNNFSDVTLVRIADFQDRRLSDSLYFFLKSKDATHRRAAILAFASIQDTTTVEAIGEIILNDPDLSVRSAAAYALGQTGGQQAFSYLLKAIDDGSREEEFLEALGKTAYKNAGIDKIISSWGLYRLALRGLAGPDHTDKAIELLQPGNDESTRLGAAHFFSRGPSDVSAAQQALISASQSDTSVFVRMAAVSALRKIKSEEVKQALIAIYNVEKDYRVRINTVRSLQPYPLRETLEILSEALTDENINVSIATSEVIRQAASSNDYASLVSKARASLNWRVKANLYESALSVSSHKELSEEIVQLCGAATNNYEKAALIGALSHAPIQYGFVKDQLITSSVPVIRTAAITAITRMNRHANFESSMQPSFLETYKQALVLNDPAVIGMAVSALADSILGYKNVIHDFRFLYEAKEKLTLPKDNEALQPLENAIAFFEGRKPTPPVNAFNHPIDWALVKTIPRDQRVLIKTAKGDIEIQLIVEEAPGSVANFLQLAQSGYYDSKNFHRVVPNFVIQGGCNRGDGWGGEDYSIRSEFSLRRYKEGSVGMASAGKDTEGTQWFITHSPTPHLDGRYTIFAEVVTGMDVVHRMEVGDVILSVEILKR